MPTPSHPSAGSRAGHGLARRLGFTAALALAALSWRAPAQPTPGSDAPQVPAIPALVLDLPAAARPAPPPLPKTEHILRVAGSYTLGARLAPDLAKAFLQQVLQAQYVVIKPGPAAYVHRVEALLPGEPRPRRIEIVAAGSAHGFHALAAGEADVALTTRPPLEAERALLAARGDLNLPGAEQVLGLEALAVIGHPTNPLENLSIDEVRRIYTGEATDWSQVGGGKMPIVRYACRESSAYDFFASHVLLPGDRFTEQITYLTHGREVIERVRNEPAAIGYVASGDARGIRPFGLVATRGAPLSPTLLNIRREDYPLTRRLYVYTPPLPPNPVAQAFAEFAISEAGQTLVARAGFIEQAAKPVPAVDAQRLLPSYTPKRYLELIQNADAIPIDFHFEADGLSLDSKGRADLERLTVLLSEPRYRDRRLILIGFADTAGRPETNQRLSLERAISIRRELANRGIVNVAANGLGHALPIASNDSPEGRLRNRRVEIWLAQ